MASLPRAREHRPEDRGADATVISLRGAALAYGDRVLWRDLDLDVESGEFLAVLGPNGSGKTSFVRALLGPCVTLGRSRPDHHSNLIAIPL